MDGSQFDTLTRVLSSRRTALAGSLSGLAALLGFGPEDARAHIYSGRCRMLTESARRRACLRRARAHNRPHQGKSYRPALICANLNRCGGGAANNSGKLINGNCLADVDFSHDSLLSVPPEQILRVRVSTAEWLKDSHRLFEACFGSSGWGSRCVQVRPG